MGYLKKSIWLSWFPCFFTFMLPWRVVWQITQKTEKVREKLLFMKFMSKLIWLSGFLFYFLKFAFSSRVVLHVTHKTEKLRNYLWNACRNQFKYLDSCAIFWSLCFVQRLAHFRTKKLLCFLEKGLGSRMHLTHKIGIPVTSKSFRRYQFWKVNAVIIKSRAFPFIY